METRDDEAEVNVEIKLFTKNSTLFMLCALKSLRIICLKAKLQSSFVFELLYATVEFSHRSR